MQAPSRTLSAADDDLDPRASAQKSRGLKLFGKSQGRHRWRQPTAAPRARWTVARAMLFAVVVSSVFWAVFLASLHAVLR